jgi:IMP dehydrogenase
MGSEAMKLVLTVISDVEDDVKETICPRFVQGELNEKYATIYYGLRAGMGYCGSKDIPTLQETGRFVRITAVV